MKSEVKVSAVQFAPAWLDSTVNAERMRGIADQEAQGGADLVVFPELANIGYITPVIPGGKVAYKDDSEAEFAVRYAKAAELVPGPTTDALSEVAQRHGCWIVVGLAQRHPRVDGSLYNAAVLVGPRGVVGIHHKAHIPLNEKHFFYPGTTADVWETDLGRIGLGVCYDGRFPEYSRVLALKGAEIICNVWAIPAGLSGTPGTDTLKHRAYVRAQENGLFYVCCNRTGSEGPTRFIGHSAIAGPTGALLAASESDEEDVLRAVLHGDDILDYRTFLTIFRDRRPDLYGEIGLPLSASQPAESRPENGERDAGKGADRTVAGKLTDG